MRVSVKPEACRACLLLVLAIAVLFAPSTLLGAKTLASQALAEGVAGGTLNQVKQELLLDLAQKQKYEYDEEGMETLGRNLLSQGETKPAVEILQINQMVHHDSPGAANALADAYRASGDDIQARVFYDMALNRDPDNDHAREATAEQGDAQQLAMGAMGDTEFDPAAMQAALAQSGVEMTPEQMEKMQEAMAQMEKYQENPGAVHAAEKQRAEDRQRTAQRQTSSATAEPVHESEFCEVLHRFNADKKITDPELRARFEGNYPVPGAKMKSWNVETACNDFLVAVPLWADVSPPILRVTSSNVFEDATGGTWVFQMGGHGQASGVVYTDPQGTVFEMERVGDPITFE